MSVDVSQRLADIADTIDGITKTFANVPRTVVAAELPAVVIVPRNLLEERISYGAKAEVQRERQYDIVFLALKVNQGTETQAQTAVESYLDTIRAAYISRPNLNITDATEHVLKSQLQLDTGFSIIPYGGDDFAGVIFPINVTTVSLIAMND